MIAPRNMSLGKGEALRFELPDPESPETGDASESPPRAQVLGGSTESGIASNHWGREPFATIRSAPVRFAIGVPLVFLAAAAAGASFWPVGPEVAVAVLLVVQAVGLIALYIPALRRRTDPLRTTLPRRDDPAPIDAGVRAAPESLEAVAVETGR